MSQPIIMKIGGSLIRQRNCETLREIGVLIARQSLFRPLLIVPGGGPFADLVRQYGNQLNLSEPTCHFMALLAMDQYANLLHTFIPGSKLTDLDDLVLNAQTSDIDSDQPQILFCSRFFRQVPENILPRSWEVTSDSIATYIAGILNSSLLVILKSIDIDFKIQVPDVDEAFRQFRPFNLPVWFINGVYPERIERFFKTGTTEGVYLPTNSFSGKLYF